MGSRKEREGGTTGASGGRPHRSSGRRLGKGRWWAAQVDRRPTPNHELSRSSPLSPASSGRGGRVRHGELVLVSASSAPVLLLPTPAAQPCVPDQPPRDLTPPQRVPTPSGHYSNPVDNMIVVGPRLNGIPIADETPFVAEARNAIEILQTAMAQREKYTHTHESLHSTPLPSHSYSRSTESPTFSSI